MKKLLAIVLCVSMFMVAGCGGSSEKTASGDSSTETVKSENQSEAYSETESEETSAEEETEEDTTVETVVLLDENDIYVEYRGLAEYSSTSWLVNLYIENNSDVEIYVSLRNVLVNDCKVSIANNSATIQPESKYLVEPNFDFVLDIEDVVLYGLSNIDTIEYDLEISTDILGTDIIAETQVDLDVNKKITIDTNTPESGEVILDSEDVYVEYRGIEEYSSQSWIINLYVENKRDSEIYLSLEDSLINGFNISVANNGITIPSNSKYLSGANFDLVIDVEDLESYGIAEVDAIKTELQIKTSIFGDTIAEAEVSF